jgi:DNA-binding NtrC family response regulator
MNMPKTLQVLLVEDRPEDAELVLRELRRAGFDVDWKVVDTEVEYLNHLHEGLDLILSDYQMPLFNGLRALELLRERGLDVPFIIVSGSIGEDIAVAAMQRGAADYLLKDRLARLGLAVGHALEQGRARREHRQAEQEIQNQLHELRRWHEATLGREERILELKLEVNELLAQQNQPARYDNPSTP